MCCFLFLYLISVLNGASGILVPQGHLRAEESPSCCTPLPDPFTSHFLEKSGFVSPSVTFQISMGFRHCQIPCQKSQQMVSTNQNRRTCGAGFWRLCAAEERCEEALQEGSEWLWEERGCH